MVSHESPAVYLDHAATTPLRASSLDAMMPFLGAQFANPSGSHRFARAARRAVDEARDAVAAVVGCDSGEVVFTSGGTEGDNTVIRGVIERCGGRAVCSAAEHPAVLEPVRRQGGVVVGVDDAGHVDLGELSSVLDEDDASTVVSVMAVNNEVGTVSDLAAVAEVVRRSSSPAVLHTDAVQATTWLDLRTLWPHVDVMTVSAHKCGGPKGIGALVVRRGTPLGALLVGGGQERDMRSGTHNVAGIVGLAEAMTSADRERAELVPLVRRRRDALLDAVADGLRGVVDVCETVPRSRTVAGAAHVCFSGLENEALLYLLDEAGVCASAASACAAGAMEPSHVLAAMGVPRARSAGALRLTLGRTTTDDDVRIGAAAVVASVRRVAGR